MIAGYIGLSDKLDRAMWRFACAYADQTEADHQALLKAVAHDGPILLATHEESGGPIPVPAGVKDARGAILASAAIDTDSNGNKLSANCKPNYLSVMSYAFQTPGPVPVANWKCCAPSCRVE